jgi:hypothetical protein
LRSEECGDVRYDAKDGEAEQDVCVLGVAGCVFECEGAD